jgi:hypothetical protein
LEAKKIKKNKGSKSKIRRFSGGVKAENDWPSAAGGWRLEGEPSAVGGLRLEAGRKA